MRMGATGPERRKGVKIQDMVEAVKKILEAHMEAEGVEEYTWPCYYSIETYEDSLVLTSKEDTFLIVVKKI